MACSCFELGHVDLLHCADRPVAGVVDEHVDLAEPLEAGGHGRGDVIRLGHVQADGRDAVGCFAHEFVERLGMASGGDDPVAGGQRRLREG